MTTQRTSWRAYRVTHRQAESDNVTSLTLASADGQPLVPFIAGQFLTFRLTGPDGRPLARNYSISSDPFDQSCYRISVKREPRPAGRSDLLPGFGSSYMHDDAAVGTVLEGSIPKGQFQLDQSSDRPLLLLAGGIGITPLLAMAHALSRTPRPVFLIHACENGRLQPFASEVADLKQRHPQLMVVTCLREPTAADRTAAHHQFDGVVTAHVLRAVLPLGNYDVYLCGPAGFMQAMYDLLVELGVRETQIHYEFFGPATVLKAKALAASVIAAPQTERTSVTDGAIEVTFSGSGKSVIWDSSFRNLLDFAEAHGLSPAFSCRNGICSTCLCALDGEVTYVDEPLEEPGPGRALICCSIPKSAVTLGI